MNDFTASNGFQIVDHLDGVHIIDDEGRDSLRDYSHMSGMDMKALREFFQAEGDERLGRWRWPESPDYVVYQREGYPPENARRVRVILESTGDFVDTVEGSKIDGPFKDAARAYFDTHPEQKPWHDAQIGELWVIRLDGQDEVGVSVEGFESGADVFQIPGGESISITRPSIIAGRRIWPEVSS